MVERESRGNGDQINAIERVARRCKIGPRALRRVISGETKDPGIVVYANIRAAFVEQLSRIISELQAELKIEFSKGISFDIWPLSEQLDDIRSKIEASKEG